MALANQGSVGAPTGVLGDGVARDFRYDAYGAQVVQLASGRFREAVLRGNCYAGQTAATGVAPGTAIGTGAAFALYNPAGSGKRLVILRATMAYVSGTLGSGFISWCASTNVVAAAVTGTAITAVNCLIGGPSAAVGKPLTTATLPAAPTPVAPFCSMAPLLATSVVQPFQVVDEVAGGLVVDEGGAVSLQETGAGGTAPLVVFSVTWEEVTAP